MKSKPGQGASGAPDLIRHHYDVETELAAKLRNASKDERRAGLYASIYRERLERIPSHPLLLRAHDETATAHAVEAQLGLLEKWLRPDMDFLEVGPGDCTLAVAVASSVRNVYAVDVTDALLDDAEYPPNFRFIASDGVTVSVPEGTIHLAYSNQVLEHLHPDDARDQLVAIWKALAPGGRFICITPNRLSGPWDISRQFDDVARGLHLREYTLSELVDLLRSVGFEVHLFASYKGRHIATVVPERPVRVFESAIGRLPRDIRRRLAWPLTAVKVLATRPESG